MIKFSGTRQEFGKFYGERLKSLQHDFYSHVNMPTLRKQLKIYEEYYPEFIEERLVAAETAGVDPNFLLYEDLASFVDIARHRIEHRKHGCTIFAIHENENVFVGRNYDWLPQAREFFEQYDINSTGAHRYFSFSDESVWNRHTGKKNRKLYAEDALNEHGLYIGLTYAHIDKWDYGLSPSHMILYIAEHCKTTRQALNAFLKIPLATPKNFLIADKSGAIAVVEHAVCDLDIIKPNDQGILIQTNHCLSPKLQSLDQIYVKNPRPTSFVRYEEAKWLIQTQLPGFQFTDIWRILRQSHYVYNRETIWSLALQLNTGRYNLYSDTAMGQKQQKFSF